MRIAVIQHRERERAADGARALAQAAARASEVGAEAVFLPASSALSDPAARSEFESATDGLPGTRVVPLFAAGTTSRALSATGDLGPLTARLGDVALLFGDACFERDQLERLAAEKPPVLVMLPRSESDLQAEAVLELALGLSESTSGLVVVIDTTGGEPGEPGHGSSAIILLGDVMAEAYEDDEILYADIIEPVPEPEAALPLPQLPTILEQRLASHQGRRLDPGYPADLS